MTDAPRALRVNASAITRTLPRHLREPFKRELTERLLARRGERVSVDDIRTIAADVLRGMARARESWPQESEQDDKWSFCLTAGTLCPANQERQ